VTTQQENSQESLLAFLDLETTGLDTATVNVLEAALLVVDPLTWSFVAKGSWLVLPVDRDEVTSLTDRRELLALAGTRLTDEHLGTAYGIHARSRLLPELLAAVNHDQGAYTVIEVERFMTERIRSQQQLYGGRTIYLAGSGVAEFDRPIVRRLMPELDTLFHYRAIDLGVMRRTLTFAGLQLPDRHPFGDPAHRALADVHQSAAQLAWFRTHLQLMPEMATTN